MLRIYLVPSFFLISACANDSYMTNVVEKDNTIAEGDTPGECSDGIDNDGDEHIDCDDQDCEAETACVPGNPPIIDSLVLSPEAPQTNSIVTADLQSSDPDGDPVTVDLKWFVDNVEISVEELYLDGLQHFDKHQEIVATATPNDGENNGETVTSNTLTVVNTPPTAPVIQVTPDPANEGALDFTCTIIEESMDLDEDAITYTFDWIDESGTNQRSVANVVALTDTLPPELVTAGTWTCIVTPSDGEDAGPEGSDSAVVEAQPVICQSLAFQDVTYVDFGNQPILFSPGPEFTVELWAKWDGNSTFSQVLLSSISSNSSGGWHIAMEDGHWRGHIRAQDDHLTAGYPLPQSKAGVGQWTHLAMTISHNTSQTDLSFFVNGIPMGSDSDASGLASNGAEYIVLGNQQDLLAANRQFTGEINAVRISNGIRYTTMFTPPLQFANDTDTAAVWDLSLDSGLTVTDPTGNGYTGSINGASWTTSCPTEDLDQDGIQGWQDCADNNASILQETPYLEPTTGDTFWACEAEVTWHEAQTSCVGRGHQLTWIENATVNTWLGQEMTNHFSNPANGWWIGLNDLSSSTNFSWISGHPLSYTNWANGNPNHITGEDCGLMYDANGGVHAWHDAVCDLLTGFVCR